jgi:muconolactone delta-isomerase
MQHPWYNQAMDKWRVPLDWHRAFGHSRNIRVTHYPREAGKSQPRFILKCSKKGVPMKILAIEKEIPGVTDEQCEPFLKTEAARVWELYRSGQLRESYFRADRSQAVLIFECTGGEEVHQLLATLPLVKEGLIDFEIVPLIPYPGFARLFV